VRALEPLREREFRLLFAGRVVSLAGSAIASVALTFAVLELTGSATDLGLVLAATWVPQIVFILVGGVWADRLPRNAVMVASNLLSGAVQLVTAALLLTDSAEIWHLVVLQVLRGVASSFFFPASQGIVPQTVSAEHLQEANALLRLSLNGTMIGGTAIGGLVVAAVGSGWAIAFDGATYIASAAILGAMSLLAARREGGRNFLGELAEGWGEFRSRTWVWAVVLQACVGNMARMGGFFVLGPLVAQQTLGGAAPWGLILAFEGIGLIIGGLIALRLRPERPLYVGVAALLLMAPLLALLAIPASVPVLAAASLVAGVGLELFSVYWDTSLQQHIPERVLSRVSSYDAFGSFVAIPVGMTLAGPVSDAIGVEAAIWVATALTVGSVLFALSFSDVRELRRLDRVAPAAGEALA
jgi:predicted MFS family arabinose efflux permease